MLPAGSDAVVMLEHTWSAADGGLQVIRPVAPGENRTLRGDDAATGVVVVSVGRRIGAADLGILAACGVERLTVIKKPIVTVLTTGDEIIDPGEQPKPGQIRDVNSYTLTALAEEAGCEVRLPDKIPDDQDLLLTALTAAVAESDIVLISGGSSVGDRDFTTSAVQALPGVTVLFHGVALKPGKPTLMAVVGETAVFGIPGHTVAAMTVFQEIVAPAIAARLGMPQDCGRVFIRARLGEALRPDLDRDEIFRVRLERRNDGVIAWPLPARSGLITVMTRADGMVYAKAGQAELQAGEVVEVQLLLDRMCGTWRGELR
jgi:molybdopterin molybdotransferase